METVELLLPSPPVRLDGLPLRYSERGSFIIPAENREEAVKRLVQWLDARKPG